MQTYFRIVVIALIAFIGVFTYIDMKVLKNENVKRKTFDVKITQYRRMLYVVSITAFLFFFIVFNSNPKSNIITKTLPIILVMQNLYYLRKYRKTLRVETRGEVTIINPLGKNLTLKYDEILVKFYQNGSIAIIKRDSKREVFYSNEKFLNHNNLSDFVKKNKLKTL